MGNSVNNLEKGFNYLWFSISFSYSWLETVNKKGIQSDAFLILILL